MSIIHGGSIDSVLKQKSERLIVTLSQAVFMIHWCLLSVISDVVMLNWDHIK